MGLFDWFRKRKKTPPAGGPLGTWPNYAQQSPPGQVPPAPPPLPGSATPAARGERKQARRGPLNLDLGQFAPLSHADAKAQAKALGSPWRSAMFGRRDLIPPVSDPRTLLVDRAMVGFGFITPEDLAEIHKLGEQMDAVRPD